MGGKDGGRKRKREKRNIAYEMYAIVMRESSERDMEEHGKDEEASDELKARGALAD